MNCSNCGAKIADPNQHYCEKCGSELPTIKEQPISSKQAASKQTYSRQVPPIKGGLFDINRNYYILKEKYWDWGSGDILDEKGQVIGKMKRIILSIRKRIELQEIDGTIAATIHHKLVSARFAQDLKDSQGNLIARIKKKILSFFRPVFYLESPNGTRWFEAQGEFMGWSYKIKDLSTGNIVAEIEKTDRWRDIFLGGLFDFKDTYALKIHDNETDRRILVGFVLSIDNILFDQHSGMVPFVVGFPRRRGPGRIPRGPRPGGFPKRLPGGFPRYIGKFY